MEVLLEGGTIASRGAGAGPVYILDDGEPEKVPDQAVLVTRRALPEYGLAVGRIAAMLCVAGNTTSHLATVLREAAIPALFGAKDALSRLTPGEEVTVISLEVLFYWGNFLPFPISSGPLFF